MNKKMIAPIVITVLFVAYYIFYFGLIITLIDMVLVNVLFGIIPFALALVMIYVCLQRIKEIRSGEEDDLSKY